MMAMADQRRTYAHHEAGHAVVAELLGGRVRMVTLGSRVAHTWHTPPIGDVERAAVLWAGVVGESLVDRVLAPSAWIRQDDYVELRALPSFISNRGFELAESLLLGNPDHALQVGAVADALLRRRTIGGARRLLGTSVRHLMENPPQPEVHDSLELGFA
jgi:hypothetical protein